MNNKIKIHIADIPKDRIYILPKDVISLIECGTLPKNPVELRKIAVRCGVLKGIKIP